MKGNLVCYTRVKVVLFKKGMSDYTLNISAELLQNIPVTSDLKGPQIQCLNQSCPGLLMKMTSLPPFLLSFSISRFSFPDRKDVDGVRVRQIPVN